MFKWICILGVVVMIGSLKLMSMTRTQEEWEKIPRTELVPGNRGKATATGAIVGGGLGAGVGAAIGGVGLAACGTGIGIPAGIVCFGLAALVGGIGGGIGYLSGKPDTTVTTIDTVVHTYTYPIVPSWICWVLFGMGMIMVVYSISKFWTNSRAAKEKKEEA